MQTEIGQLKRGCVLEMVRKLLWKIHSTDLI